MTRLLSIPTNAINWGSPVNRACPLNRGLVAWWPFAGPSGGSGTVANLCSSNTGALSSTATWETSRLPIVNRSIRVDGTSTGKVTFASSIASGTTFTYSLWIKPNTPTSSYGCIGANASSGPFLRGSGAGANNLKLDWVASGSHLSSTALTDGEWCFVTAVSASASLSWYQNGVFVNTPAGAIVTANLSFLGTNGFDHTKANMADVRFWDRALSADEVAAVYQDSLTGYQKTLNRLTRTFAYSSGAAAGPVIPVFMNQYRQRVA